MNRRRTGKVGVAVFAQHFGGDDQVTRRKPSHDIRAILIQGDSVRMTWGMDEKVAEPPRPLRRDGAVPIRSAQEPAPPSEDLLRIRLGEELDYVRRLLDVTAGQLTRDPILIRRHALELQSLDKIAQILIHVGDVIRSRDPNAAVENIEMSDLKARLKRRGSLSLGKGAAAP